MDEITNKVKKMYESYPFPSCNMINVAYGNRVKDDLSKRGYVVNKLKILEAGCGTGEKAISLAKVFCDSEVIGWDVSKVSVEKADQLAKKEKVNNMKFENVDLLNVDLYKYEGYFDLIISWGVIHHLSDTVKGLENLGLCLKPTGLIYVWVYALHSLQRIETRLCRETIKILLKKDGFSYEKGIKIANAIKGLLKTLNYSGKKDFLMRLKWFFNKDVNKKQVILHILKNIRKIKLSLDYDANIVDAFLHANEKDYSVRMVFDEAEKAGLEVVDFIEPTSKIEDFVKSDFVRRLYYGLDLIDRLEVMERIVNPGNLIFLAKRKI
ncbi:MAG: class I SAM-dependent methyltransferase [Candidatus Omnitrophota bacterium]|nr:class I SAM-dependent methyltransferase [Candidatus Omnitrophota bacterium]